MDKLSDKALKLILDFEGINTPGQWPGGDSGITVGYGYDLGYVTVDQFESDWHDLLSDDIRLRLKPVVGLHGIKARNRAPDLAISEFGRRMR